MALALSLSRWLPSQQPPAALDEGTYRVQRVVDGDTLVLTGGTRVRLIGADTPETVHPDLPVQPWGPEATEFTRRFVSGRPIRLQFDGRKQDRHGRVLAHVWVDDRMLGEALIRAGLATAETRYRYSARVKNRLLTAQGEAQAQRRGIWSGKTR